MVCEERVRQVPVTTCRWVRETKTCKIPYCVNKQVPFTVTQRVSRCVAKQVPVTCTRMVAKCVPRQVAYEVCRKVPITVCPKPAFGSLCPTGGCGISPAVPYKAGPPSPESQESQKPAPGLKPIPEKGLNPSSEISAPSA